MDKYTHGGNIYDNLIKYDFSANINPLGMPLKVKQTIVDNIPLCEHYPDVDYRELKKEIAAFRKVDEECVLCGNGAIEIIYKICSVVKPQRALLAIPCFSEYEKALSEALAHIVKYNRSEEYDFRLREDYIDYLTPDIDMAILCQPNNPSGDMIEKDLLDKIIKKALEANGYERKLVYKLSYMTDNTWKHAYFEDKEEAEMVVSKMREVNKVVKIYSYISLNIWTWEMFIEP